jgi:hypothetical protein
MSLKKPRKVSLHSYNVRQIANPQIATAFGMFPNLLDFVAPQFSDWRTYGTFLRTAQ